jgi:hypothetical protein
MRQGTRSRFNIVESEMVLYPCAFKERTLAMAGRDAGRYHDVVAAGLRARHVHLYESALVFISLQK